MRVLLLAMVAGVIVGLFFGMAITVARAEPPRPEQKRPDIFPIDPQFVPRDVDGDGDRDMQDLNPTTIKAKRTRAIAYRVALLSGCNAGLMPADLEYMNTEEAPKVGLALSRNDQAPDFIVFISCGLTQIQKCGSVNVFCLADGFPGNTNVYMSDVLSNWDRGSRIGIPLHEIVGHAVGTWNEQYATCGASCGFAPTPGLRDVMNTGPESRHGLEAVELERWERTMWALVDPCAPVETGGGWSYTTPQCEIPNGNWYFNDIWVFGACDPSWNARYVAVADEWENIGESEWYNRLGFHVTVPPC